MLGKCLRNTYLHFYIYYQRLTSKKVSVGVKTRKIAYRKDKLADEELVALGDEDAGGRGGDALAC